MKKLLLTGVAVCMAAFCFAQQNVTVRLLGTEFHGSGFNLNPFCMQVNGGPCVTSAQAKAGDRIKVSAATSAYADRPGYFTVNDANPSPAYDKIQLFGENIPFFAGPGHQIEMEFQVPADCDVLYFYVDVYPVPE